MEDSNASGCLLFTSNQGSFIIALGIHDGLGWCDMVPNLSANQPVSAIQAEYYDVAYEERRKVKERQLSHHSMKCGTDSNVAINYAITEGHHLEVNIAIGRVYIVTIHVHHLSTDTRFDIVERDMYPTGHGKGWWSDNDDSSLKLTMKESGNCGCLRFKSGLEAFAVVLGIHDYKRWCDIVPHIMENHTSEPLQAQFYDQAYYDKCTRRWNQMASCTVKTQLGTEVVVEYTVDAGLNLDVNIFIR